MERTYHILTEEEIKSLDAENPKRKRFYVYKITCLKTGHVYIGQRSNCYKPPELDIKYMGSGHIINVEKEKYGIEFFEKEILYQVTNQNDLNLAEKFEIAQAKEFYGDRSKSRKGLCINVTDGGLVGCGFDHINKDPEKRKMAMDAAKKARADKHDGDCMGACHTKEATLKGMETRIKNGSYQASLNILHSKESRLKAQPKAVEKYLFCDENGTLFVMSRNTAKQYHSDWTQMKRFSEGSDEEQSLALENTNKLKKEKRNTYVWIHKDGETKTITPSELETFLNEGWEKGRGKLKKKNIIKSDRFLLIMFVVFAQAPGFRGLFFFIVFFLKIFSLVGIQ